MGTLAQQYIYNQSPPNQAIQGGCKSDEEIINKAIIVAYNSPIPRKKLNK